MRNALKSLTSLFRFPNVARDGYAPYGDSKCDQAYNQLFCDKVNAYRREFAGSAQTRSAQTGSAQAGSAGPWSTLINSEPYLAGLRAIAENPEEGSRARLLASFRLRELQQPPVPKELLGVVVEVRLSEGLDVLAAYRDGTVRYIHHRGAIFVFEPAPLEWQPTLLRILSAAQAAVDRIGPWQPPRVAPPTEGMVRMSFLASDGLYFGQGLLTVMAKDELAGPIITAGTELLKLVTDPSG